LLIASTVAAIVSAQIKEKTIDGMAVKVIQEYRSTFKTQFVELVIPDELYSRENLESIWRHYCEKYSDKKDRLDVRVYANRSYEFNRHSEGRPLNMHTGEVTLQDGKVVKLREPEAYFERKGDGVLAAYGGDNEYMTYSPDIDRPEEKVRLVLAGKDASK
jgi:hypothetical protein